VDPRLKIVVASSGLGHVARGIEAWADDLGTALAERDLSVTLCKGGGVAERGFERVLPCWQRESARTKRLLRWLPRRFFWRFGLGGGYEIEQLTFARRLVRLLRRERADILHVQDPLVARFTQRARALGMVRAKTILAHGTEESLSFLGRIKYLQHLAPWHLERAREAGVWKPTWTAIPNFIDTTLFAPGRSPTLRAELSIPEDALVVLSVAAIKRHHKRVDHLVAEFARLREAAPDLPAWLVVAGGWETQTDQLIAEAKERLGDRVRFLVRFPRARMPELYRAADIFVLCSLFEMQGIVLIEAAAAQLACVAHEHPIFEWVTGPGAVRINMSATGALARTLERLLRSPGERDQLASHGRQYCQANFSRAAVLEQILRYYELVARRGPKAVTPAENPTCV
jgi:glycosyltransferase involved in cell wall biosynthesis